MKVYLKKDIPHVGHAGQIIKVKDGYAHNFLFPNQWAIEITESNESFYLDKVKQVEHKKEVVASETSELAEKINNMHITIKRKVSTDKQLYASIAPQEIVEGLAQKGISVAKSKVQFGKSIKTVGTHEVVIKLSTRLQPKLTVKVVAE